MGGDFSQSLEWFREFLKWRLESGLDTARKEVIGMTPEQMLAWWTKRANPFIPLCPYAGRSSDGHIIWYMAVGHIDAEKFINYRQIPISEDLLAIHLVMEWTLWHLNCLSRAEGRMVCVVKLNDFTIGKSYRKLPFFVAAFRKFLTELLEGDNKYYCEHNALFLVINAPRLLRMIFAAARMVMSERQISKIRVLGETSAKMVRDQLLEIVPTENLMVAYGGNLAKAPGAFPLATQEEVERWYNCRHLLPKMQESEIPIVSLLTNSVAGDEVRRLADKQQDIIADRQPYIKEQCDEVNVVESTEQEATVHVVESAELTKVSKVSSIVHLAGKEETAPDWFLYTVAMCLQWIIDDAE